MTFPKKIDLPPPLKVDILRKFSTHMKEKVFPNSEANNRLHKFIKSINIKSKNLENIYAQGRVLGIS